MGGSSLCCDVLSRAFGPRAGYPRLSILDSTDPRQIAAFDARLDLRTTLFFVSSKSGSTLEPNVLMAYYFDRMVQTVGADAAGEHFAAVTDPGSALEAAAGANRFRRIMPGLPDVGGRFSALTNFGLAPAAVAGIDVTRLLDRANRMACACSPSAPAADNPGLVLGAALGAAAMRHGVDKVTIIASPAVASFGGWLEQLLAESTGKHGKGLIPVDGEGLFPPEHYGPDRHFVYLRWAAALDSDQERGVAALEAAGRPVVQVELSDACDVGREFFRWEFATAVAGAVMELDPFNQPDVEASKVATRELTSAYEQSGRLPGESPFLVDRGIALYADARNLSQLNLPPGGATVSDALAAHLMRISPGDYFAILAFVDMCEEFDVELRKIRRSVCAATSVATCLGYGPRFLHSTGQAYKGGPDSGVFLQITCDDPDDLPIPGRAGTFGVIKQAQARGDFQVLADRRRRALRVHLAAPVSANLRRLRELLSD
jgi:transaldolase/glucose-6-phosphate isomerase